MTIKEIMVGSGLVRLLRKQVDATTEILAANPFGNLTEEAPGLAEEIEAYERLTDLTVSELSRIAALIERKIVGGVTAFDDEYEA